MEITQQLREYAREKGIDEEQAVAAGLLEKSGEFKESGGEIYQAP
jgi:phosphomethylpyrimidine synthase